MGEAIRYDVGVTIKPEHRQALAGLLANAAQGEGDGFPGLARRAFVEDEGWLRIDGSLGYVSDGELVEFAEWIKAYCKEGGTILWCTIAGDVRAYGYVFDGKGKAKWMEIGHVGEWH